MRYNIRIRALADFLDCDPADVKATSYDPHLFDAPGRAEYLVLTDREATRRALAATRESLWAFNTAFLARYVPCLQRDPLAAEAFDTMRGKLCEDANPLVTGMLGRALSRCVNDAMTEDGRGHVLSGYDGEEHEVTVGRTFYIYRQH